MISKLVAEIVRDSISKQGALARLTELRIAAQEHFFAGKEWTSKDERLLSGVGKDEVDAVFSQAEKELEGTESLVIYTAIDLPEEVAVRVGKRARELFGPEIILDFKVDAQILGGAALSWHGQYKDYSLRTRFEEKKEEVEKIYLSNL